MSPEQLKGMTLDGRSDIWSLGVVLYEMAAGKRLFEGTTATDIAVSVVTTGPTKMSRLTRGIPRRLKEVIGKCLAIDREERYQNVRDLLLDLKALQRRLETRSGSSRLPTSRVFSAMAGQAGGRRPAKRSIAVLPFAYAGTAKGPGRDPDEQYLADGVTETIINCLSRVADLRVIARSSAFRYRDLEADLEKVASALGVRHLLVGRILHDAEEIRISVELVSSQRQVWGEQYRLRPDRLADLPAEIAGEVARTLCPPDAKPAPRARTPNPEAYRAYLKGRHFWNKRTAQGLQKAVEHFQQAIAADPGYALAYVGLADCHHVMWVYTADTSPRDFYPIAKAEVMKALEIEPDLAEAHATLAAIKGDNEWEFAAAEREFRRAIELNPNYATAYQWLGEILTYTGRFKELLKTAHDLDPLSPVIAAVAGDVLLRAGRYERAIEELQVALQIDENFGLAHTTLRDAYELMGDFEQATVHEEIAEMLAGATAEAAEAHATGLRQAYVEGGEPAYWRMRLDHALHRFQESASWYDSSPFRIAEMCARLGEPEQACDWLERALKGGDVRVVYARSSPAFGKLQSHPRFAALVSSSGVPQPATAAPTGEERF
jgi:TolB-like protein/tetratricopeptide (TPR) repeat protein